MKNDILFSTQSHTYLYSCRHLECIPVHPIFQRIWNLLASGESVEIYKDVELSKYHKKQVDYYLRKYHYLKDNFLGFVSETKSPVAIVCISGFAPRHPIMNWYWGNSIFVM